MPPLVVGIGGTSRPGSTTERALALALARAERAGARTRLCGGEFLSRLPLFVPERQTRTEDEVELVDAVRRSDAVVIASPAYHGGVSALVKNALDLLEDLRDDGRPYLDGRAVGCVVTAAGWQGCGSALAGMRSIVHALRGWPTPLGVTLNTTGEIFDADGVCTDVIAARNLALLGAQVADFALRGRLVEAGTQSHTPSAIGPPEA